MLLESIVKISFGLIVLSFLICYFDSIFFFWFWIWCFIVGVVSSVLMILVVLFFLFYVKEYKKVLVGGFIFSVVGIGFVFSGFVLFWISFYNIKWVWIFLGGSCLIVFIFFLVGLKICFLRKKFVKKEESVFKIFFYLWLLLVFCVFNVIGFLLYMFFWVDYLICYLNIFFIIVGILWVFFGFGVMFGFLISGFMV